VRARVPLVKNSYLFVLQKEFQQWVEPCENSFRHTPRGVYYPGNEILMYELHVSAAPWLGPTDMNVLGVDEPSVLCPHIITSRFSLRNLVPSDTLFLPSLLAPSLSLPLRLSLSLSCQWCSSGVSISSCSCTVVCP